VSTQAVGTLAVVGTGLIGASAALAARTAGVARVVGWDPDPDHLAVAAERGAVDPAASLDDAVATADVVLVASPVGELPETVRVPGRFEPVVEGQPFAVLVDYAHTPDSLENVLLAARPLTGGALNAGRVIVVFGAGGDRDRAKRPLMGAVACDHADVVIVTSDNPRSEEPEAIVAEILRGCGAGADVEVDRRAAIDRAIGLAEPGDVVVIAGKGHEQGQEFEDGRKIPFDDVGVAREALRARLVA